MGMLEVDPVLFAVSKVGMVSDDEANLNLG